MVGVVGAIGSSKPVRYLDTTVDVAEVGIEIAKLMLGDNYNPEFLEKSKELAAIGKKVDAFAEELERMQNDAGFLEHSIPKLELSLGSFDSKCEIAESLVDKAKAFNDAMSSETPTALA